MSEQIILEICLETAEQAVAAQDAGADRIELCANLAVGGTTPLVDEMRLARRLLHIHLHVMIRPRGGDFCYTDSEFEQMKTAILEAKNAAVDGVVLGILNRDGTVDTLRTSKLIELAKPLQVTFHRAFDETPSPFQALEDIISTGAQRILSSGQADSALLGIELLSKLINTAGNRIIIMPGAGINANNVKEILALSKAREIHMSALQQSTDTDKIMRVKDLIQ